MGFLANMQTSFNNIYELCKDYAVTSYQTRQSRKFGPYGLAALGGMNSFTGGSNMTRSIFDPTGTSFYGSGMQNYNYSMFGGNPTNTSSLIDGWGRNLMDNLNGLNDEEPAATPATKPAATPAATPVATPAQQATDPLSTLTPAARLSVISYLADATNTEGKTTFENFTTEQQSAIRAYYGSPSTESA